MVREIALFLNWKKFLIGTLITGFLIEYLNENVYKIWIYYWPWNLYALPLLNTGLVSLTLGWLVLYSCALSLSLIYGKKFNDKKLSRTWIIGWILMGFILEFFNSKIYRTWIYSEMTIFGKFLIPFLGFGVFVPILGYGGVGLVSYLMTKYLIKFKK